MEQKNNDKASKGTIIVLSTVLILGILFFLYWFFYLKNYVSTDDAYVMADSSYVSARVPGTIEDVFVKNDDFVKKGDVLIKLDPSVYRLKVAQLKRKLESLDFKIKGAKIDLSILKHNLTKNVQKSKNDLNLMLAEKQRLRFEIKSLKAQKDVLKQDLHLADLQYRRYSKLYKKHSISKEKFDNIVTARNKLFSEIRSLDFKIKSLESSVKGLDEKIKNVLIANSVAKKDMAKVSSAEDNLKSLLKERDYLKNALEEARLNLSYCWVKAEINGYIGGSKVQRGNWVMPGQPLMVIIPLDKVYVEANFKETQLKDIRIGQEVGIKSDMYPGKVFKGHVMGIRAGTGQAFSLLPPENASGNWIKVVQRVPVRIKLDNYSYTENPLRVGTSLEVTVCIKDKSGAPLRGLHGNSR